MSAPLIFGVDITPQPNYPFRFIQDDALGFLRWTGAGEYTAVHASPPCQRYSAMTKCRPELAAEYPDLVAPTRQLLRAIDLPYVIENVPGSPLVDPITLCGHMFGYELYRHRLFESSVPLANVARKERQANTITRELVAEMKRVRETAA